MGLRTSMAAKEMRLWLDPTPPLFGQHLSIFSFLVKVHSVPRRSVLTVCMCVQVPMFIFYAA